MNKGVLVFFMLVSIGAFSQDKDNYKTALSEFEFFFNDGEYDEIYNMYNYDMKRTSSLAKTKTFFSNLHKDLGQISKVEFRNLKDLAHVYKVSFGSDVRDLLIYLDSNNKIANLKVMFHVPDNLVVIERNSTKMSLPFNEESYMLWGGVTKKENNHITLENQKYAYDFVIMKEGATHSTGAKKNENYYVFGKDVYAPCDARVVKVITGIEDNTPGELNTKDAAGNVVILETIKNEYLVLAHLKHNSIVVREGLFVRRGSLVGKCGNSGNSTEPRLHLSLQNTVDMNIATGAKMYFDKIYVNKVLKHDYLPVKGDFVENGNK